MKSLTPQIVNSDVARVTLAKDQPEYEPLEVAVVVASKDGPYNETLPYIARFEFSDSERALIAEGADLYLSQLTFGGKYRPISLTIVPRGTSLDPSDL